MGKVRRRVEFQISDFKFQSLQSLELPRATALEKRKRRDCFSPCRGRLSHGWPEPRAAGTAGTVYDIMRGEQHLTRGTFRTRGLARVGWRQAGKKRFVTATSQGRDGHAATATTRRSTRRPASLSDNKQPKIKILGNGELTKKFTVKVPCSASAKAKIEKAGGSVA